MSLYHETVPAFVLDYWSHANIHFCHEAIFALASAMKSRQHFILALKSCKYLSLPRSHDNTSFASKLCQRSTLHSYQSHEATSTIHFCHEAMTTLHISTEVMPILVFATKPCQHFIRTEAMPTFIFIMKPQHSTLALALALKLHQYLHWVTSKLHLHRSRANIHLCHEATTTLHLYWSRANIHEAMSKLYLHQRRANIHEATKSHQHFTLALELCQYSFLPWSYVNISFVRKPCQHSWSHINTLSAPKLCRHPSLPWSHDNTPH